MRPDHGAVADDGVMLRPVVPDDLEALCTFENDAESAALAGVRPRAFNAFMAHRTALLADPLIVQRAILVDGSVAGSIGLFPRDGGAEVGYWIDRAWWGRGVATRAMALFLSETSVRPLRARVLASNSASIRVLERAGFVRTGASEEPGTERYVAGLVISFVLA